MDSRGDSSAMHICRGCGLLSYGEIEVPEVSDDEAWERIAARHEPDCPFVLGRAGQRAVYVAPDGTLVVNPAMVAELAEAADVTDEDVTLYLWALALSPDEMRHDIQIWVETGPIENVVKSIRSVVLDEESATSEDEHYPKVDRA